MSRIMAANVGRYSYWEWNPIHQPAHLMPLHVQVIEHRCPHIVGDEFMLLVRSAPGVCRISFEMLTGD
jgi:hypothetical protein